MEQIGYLVNLGVIPNLCNMLSVKESKVILVILDALGNILLVSLKGKDTLQGVHFRQKCLYLPCQWGVLQEDQILPFGPYFRRV